MTSENKKYGRFEAPGRSEDAKLLTGKGQFTADLTFPDMAYAVFVRSPHGHAEILSIDTSTSLDMAGVLAVYTADDLQNIFPIPCTKIAKGRDGRTPLCPDRWPLARDRVRHLGEAVAVVIAETRTQAEDAAELVNIEYLPLEAVTRPEKALENEAPLIWPKIANNLILDWEDGDKSATESAFANAAHVVKLITHNNRLIVSAMEPRAAVGRVEDGRLTLYACSQGVKTLHTQLAKLALRLNNPNDLRIVTGDVGGGFGMKTQCYPEYPVILRSAERLGRPVKWVASREESFTSDNSARDSQLTAEMALDNSGIIQGLRYHSIQGMGAYLSASGPGSPTRNTAMCLSGCYRIPSIYIQVKCVFTNTAPIGPYRGAGRPEAAYVIERLMDMASEELSIERTEIRKRNFIPPEDMPYSTPLNVTYDSGEFQKVMEKTLPLADWDGFMVRRKKSESVGKLRGLGIACFLEHAGANTIESARIGFDNDNRLVLFSGAQSQGQGHTDAFRQLLSETLFVSPKRIVVVQGDSDLSPIAGSTTGSRTMAVGGGAFHKAGLELIEKARLLAADIFECAPADVEFKEGLFLVVGTDKSVKLENIIDKAPNGALDTEVDYEAAAPTYPNGCHVAEIEIDPQTGAINLDRYTGVDDSGRVINHMIVDGQLHGGITQGAGQVLMEEAVYGDDGQLISGSFMDYAIPRADDMPSFKLDFHPVPCRTNAIGVKGAGESGTIAALPTIMNAITDALKSAGVANPNIVDMPATPETIWRALQS